MERFSSLQRMIELAECAALLEEQTVLVEIVGAAR
jgi:hypothetical protein